MSKKEKLIQEIFTIGKIQLDKGVTLKIPNSKGGETAIQDYTIKQLQSLRQMLIDRGQVE